MKDKRLITSDTPESKLALGIKMYVQEMSEQLSVGIPAKTLADCVEDIFAIGLAGSGRLPMPAWGAAAGDDDAMGQAWGSPGPMTFGAGLARGIGVGSLPPGAPDAPRGVFMQASSLEPVAFTDTVKLSSRERRLGSKPNS